MVLVATYALSVQARIVVSQRTMVAREMREMAGSIAVEAMEVIQARAFDQAVLDGTDDDEDDPRDAFTFVGGDQHFPVDENACAAFDAGADPCDDVDDFHGMRAERVYRAAAGDITFSVDVSVQYVDDAFEREDAPSYFKEVTVRVRDAWPDGREPMLPADVELVRVAKYGF